MSPNSFLEWLINIVIKVSLYWVSHITYIFIVFIASSIGIYGIFFDFEFEITEWLSSIMKFVLFVSGVFLLFVFSGLLWIFVFWMITIIFVPYVLIIPIPIIPFIVPIPLKLVILEYVPPFKILTDRGILPFMRRNIFRFLFSEDTIKIKLKKTLEDTYSFLYDEFKIIFGEIFKNVMQEPEPIVISKDLQDDDYAIDISTEGQGEETSKEKESDVSPENKKIQDLINEELEICLRSKQSFTTSDISSVQSFYNSITDMNGYAQCYASSIKSYIDNKL